MSPGEPEAPRGAQVRSITIRLPGALALLLAVPLLLVFGLLALAGLLAGVAALVLTPWLMRRQSRADDEDEETREQTTITLDRSAYRRAGADPEGTAGRLLTGPDPPARSGPAER